MPAETKVYGYFGFLRRSALLALFTVQFCSMQVYSDNGTETSRFWAQWTNRHQVISLRFEKDLNLQDQRNGNCSDFVTAGILAYLGTHPLCNVKSLREINIVPYKDGNVTVIAVRESLLQSQTMHLQLVLPDSDLQERKLPVFVLQKCPLDNRIICTENSNTGDYRPSTEFTWFVSSTSNNANNTPYTTGRPCLTDLYTVKSIQKMTYLNVAVEAKNPAGAISRGEIIVDVDSPRIGIKTNAINGISAEEYLLLETELNLGCSWDGNNVSFRWDILDNYDNSSLQLSTDKRKERTILLPPGTLQPHRRYSVTQTVSYREKSNKLTHIISNLTLIPTVPKMRVTILGGDRLAQLGTVLSLYTTIHATQIQKENAVVRWTCYDLMAQSECRNRTSPEIKVAIRNHLSTTVHVTRDFFEAGKRYSFTVFVSSSNQSASDSVEIHATSNQVRLTLVSMREASASFLSREYVRVHATLDLSAGMAYYNWSLQSVYGAAVPVVGSRNFSDTPLTGLLSTKREYHGPYHITLVIPKKNLQYGLTYRFILEVDYGNKTAFGTASITHTLPIPPRYGYLEVSPTAGTAYQTKFNLTTQSWVDFSGEGKQLMYRFGYFNAQNGEKHFVSAWSFFPVVTDARFPIGNASQEYTLNVFAMAKDAKGETSLCLGTITTTPFESHNEINSTVNGDNENSNSTYFRNATVPNLHSTLRQEFTRRLAERTPNFAIQTLSELASLQKKDSSINIVEHLQELHLFLSFFCVTAEQYVDLLYSMYTLVADKPEAFTTTSREKIMDILSTVMEKVRINLLSHNERPVWNIKDTYWFGRLLELLVASMTIPTKNVIPVLQTLRRLSCLATEMDARPLSLQNSYFKLDWIWINPLQSKELDRYDDLQISENHFSSFYDWPCSNRENCTGFCVTKAIYETSKFNLIADDNGKTAVSDIGEVEILNPINGTLIDLSSRPWQFTISIKLHQKLNSEASVQCKMFSERTRQWTDSYCTKLRITTATDGRRVLHCTCTRFGMVAGFTMETPPNATGTSTTTAAPTTITKRTSPNVVVNRTTAMTRVDILEPEIVWKPSELIVIKFNRDCEVFIGTSEKEKNFLYAAEASIAEALNISKTRIRAINASCGSILLTVGITKSNATDQPTQLALAERLRDVSSRGDLSIHMPDGRILRSAVTLTTQRPTTVEIRTPPPTTLPFIPNLTTNWVPLGLGLFASLSFLTLLVCCILLKHTLYLKKNILTEYNSNIKDKKTKKEDIAALGKKKRIKELVVVMENEIDAHAGSPSQKVKSSSIFPRRGRNRINPLNDANAFYLPDTKRGATPNFLDIPRLALDESSSEDEEEIKESHEMEHVNANMSQENLAGKAQHMEETC